MADARGTLTGIERRRWKTLANLGDVQRALASLIVRVNAGRLDPERARTMIAGLKELGALYEARLERQKGIMRATTKRPLEQLAAELLDKMHDIDDADEATGAGN